MNLQRNVFVHGRSSKHTTKRIVQDGVRKICRAFYSDALENTAVLKFALLSNASFASPGGRPGRCNTDATYRGASLYGSAPHENTRGRLSRVYNRYFYCTRLLNDFKCAVMDHDKGGRQ